MVFLYRFLRAFVWVLYALAIVAIVALAFGFVLALFGANQAVPFAKLIADLTTRFMDPFRGLIPPTPTGKTGVIIWSALIAIAAYAVAAWVLSLVADWLTMGIERSKADAARRRQVDTGAVAAPAAPAAAAAVAAGTVAATTAYAPSAAVVPGVAPATVPAAVPVVPPIAPQPVAAAPAPTPVAEQPLPQPAPVPVPAPEVVAPAAAAAPAVAPSPEAAGPGAPAASAPAVAPPTAPAPAPVQPPQPPVPGA